MKLDRLEAFSSDRFLADYWQQRPCIISGWLEPGALPLAELLDLAVSHDLPTRLVSGHMQQQAWELVHGPLEVEDLPISAQYWTVLVQDVDKASTAVAGLLDQFRFLPDWAIDDIMISDAVDGGSVGPHVDAYDVFLVQAAGQRRWELATDFDTEYDQRFELRLLKSWVPQLAVTLEPGEALYLPAGVAHHGVALGPCQTWSVGLRTPSGPEMLFALAESLATDETAERRLPVEDIDFRNPSRLTDTQLAAIRQLLQEALSLDDIKLAEFSGEYLSRWRQWSGDTEPVEPERVLNCLKQGHSVPLAASARLALTDSARGTVLHVNGERVDCPATLALELAAQRKLSSAWVDYPAAVEQLCELDAVAAPVRWLETDPANHRRKLSST